MNALNLWWSGLEPLNRWFFIAAAFFSVFFLWQLIMAIIGLGGGEDIDTHVDVSAHDTPHDATDTVAIFKLISFRSVLAFFTLFTWAGALYLNQKMSVSLALFYALLWGLAAMVAVSMIFNLLSRMTETGNIKIDTAVGSIGTVYLNIPEGGEGEVRVACSGVMTHLKARNADGAALKAGATVKIIKVTGPNAVQVQPAERKE